MRSIRQSKNWLKNSRHEVESSGGVFVRKAAERSTRRALALSACLAYALSFCAASATHAQVASANSPASVAAPLPEPIYWKQQLFLVPYQWPSAAAPATARLVTLYVSRDRGTSWQKISEGRPDLKAFNYRAEGDGEYWFAIRTLDNRGQIWPAGPYQPELRVVVDTTMPRIDELHARPMETGVIDIQCRATDVNLDPASLRIEAQVDASGQWQPVAFQLLPVGGAAQATGALPYVPGAPLHGIWQPAAGVRPLAVRATIADRAGNSAVYQTPVDSTPLVMGPMLSQAASVAAAHSSATPTTSAGGAPIPPPLAPAAANSGWSAASTAQQPAAPPTNQSWPAGTTASAPFQLWTSGAAATDDGLTAYGNPTIRTAVPSPVDDSAPVDRGAAENMRRVPAHFAGAAKSDDVNGAAAPSNGAGPQFAPLEPFRQAIAPTVTAANSGPALVPIGTGGSSVSSTTNSGTAAAMHPNITPVGTSAPAHRPTSPPKMVGSRTFALEYDLDDNSRTGVTRVELWGTRDGGHTWTRTAVDDDCRSPLVVTVDDEGLYGFKILVQPANGAAVTPPRADEEPELWVSVDLKRPIVELTAIERGEGNLADHLILRWHVQDNNLEPRPISLFFCSRPTGPWQPIARNLVNTGEYAWRVERFVPDKIYLRIEARDVAGNLAAFETREPVEFNALPTTGRLRPATPAGPTAASGNESLR